MYKTGIFYYRSKIIERNAWLIFKRAVQQQFMFVHLTDTRHLDKNQLICQEKWGKKAYKVSVVYFWIQATDNQCHTDNGSSTHTCTNPTSQMNGPSQAPLAIHFDTNPLLKWKCVSKFCLPLVVVHSYTQHKSLFRWLDNLSLLQNCKRWCIDFLLLVSSIRF